MRTVSYRLGDLARATINIGKVAENEYTRVQFNAEQIFAEYPAATAALSVINPEGTAYPAVVTREGDLIIWDVTDADLTAAGMGELQLTLTENGVVIKSYIARTRIERSIVASGSTPDPVQNWLDEAAEVLEEVQDAIPAGGTQGQVMGKLSDDDYDIGWIDQTGGGGGGGTSNYNELSNKPQIAGTTLTGNKSLAQLGIASADDVSAKYTKPASGIPASDLASGVIPDVSGFYTKPQTGIPASDLASGVQTSLGKADTAYQKPSGGVPSSDMASVVQTSLGKADTAYQKPSGGIPAADIASGVIPVLTDLIDDTAGDGDTNKVWSADKTADEVATLSSAIAQLGGNTPENYGAKGDGVTDDSSAIQQAINSGYEVHFGDNKTYYLASAVSITHDCHLVGGKNTVIKTKTPSSGTINSAFACSGTLKKTTTITTDYKQVGNTNNAGDRFELADMDGINVGDIMVIQATDQYYSYARAYYYLGGALLVADVTDDYIFTCDSLPFDINKTENVTVKIYSAPSVIMDNLQFVSDLDSVGTYVYPVQFDRCKNSVMRNCSVSEADNGIRINECVNMLLDGITISQMPKWANNTPKDHYGVGLYSSTNTTITRLMGNTANSCIEVSGTFPSINTRITKSNLFATNRHNGFGMHEGAYNTILEDCVIGGMTGYGLMYINRCRFVQSYKTGGVTGISYRGGHNKEWSKLYVSDCVFESVNCCVVFPSIIPQSPIQAFDEVIGEVKISDCYGGRLEFQPTLSETVLSNRIINLTLDNWKNCYEFWHKGEGIIDNMIVNNCSFGYKLWMNDHSDGLGLENIRQLTLKSDAPSQAKLYADIKEFGGKYYLPEGITINCSSGTQTDLYTVCGKNIMPNKTADLSVGSVSGTVGNHLTTSETGAFSSSLSVNSDGEIVFTQPNNTNNASIFPKCLVYVPEGHKVKMSCKLKNTGETTGATFRSYIVVVSCKTGLITYRNNGTTVQATAEGAVTTHERYIDSDYGDSMVLFYLYCSTPVAESETTLSEYVAEVLDGDFDTLVFEKYNGTTRTGDGTLTSVAGENNLLTNASSDFDMNFKVDLLEKGFIPSATGVSF